MVIPLCNILIVLTLNLNFLGKSILDLVWLIEWNLITVYSFAAKVEKPEVKNYQIETTYGFVFFFLVKKVSSGNFC